MATKFEVGDLVLITGRHYYAGEVGFIVNSPGKLFNGWNIKLLKSGLQVGVSDRDLQHCQE